MAVARNDLGRDRLDGEAHLLGHIGFDARVDAREGADRTGDGAGGDLGLRRDQAGTAARKFGIGGGELEAECQRLGVNAVRAPDGRGELVLEGTAFQCGEQGVEIADEDIAGALELHRETGVEHVGGGHALMQEAGFRADDLIEMGEEGDRVVFHLALDLVDARDVSKTASLPFSHIFSAASRGITPSFAIALAAWASISKWMRKRVCGSQSRPWQVVNSGGSSRTSSHASSPRAAAAA